MPITIYASPDSVRLNTNPPISVGGRLTHGNGSPAAGKRVAVKSEWAGNMATSTGPNGDWGVSFGSPPNQLGSWYVRATSVGMGTAQATVKRIP
ncbi:MAG: hypothetical protein GY800_12010 [Planctomycetes bacterium]|nr:hypothetical protein [Planctomycetota bacterium]